MPFPASNGLVSAAEAQLGRSLPFEHRARLVADNGGEIEAIDDDWQLFPVWDPTDRRTQGRTANHIVRENEGLRDWPGLPMGFIAIAANGTGDLLGLLPGTDEVHWFDHEQRTVVPVAIDWKLT
jgi:hypothetical protein